jgi:hypothetical protein
MSSEEQPDNEVNDLRRISDADDDVLLVLRKAFPICPFKSLPPAARRRQARNRFLGLIAGVVEKMQPGPGLEPGATEHPEDC